MVSRRAGHRVVGTAALLLIHFLCVLQARPISEADAQELAGEGAAALQESTLGNETARQLAEAQQARAIAEAERRQLLLAEWQRLRLVHEAVKAEAARLENEAAAIELVQTEALGWQRRVLAVASAPGSEAAADALYSDLIDALRGIRSALSDALGGVGGGERAVPQVPPIDPALATNGEGGERLMEFQQALVDRITQLARYEQALKIRKRDTLYAAMLTMNDARLALLPALSPGLRSRITGFGEEGLNQVGREVKQIALTLRYNAATGFAGLKSFASELMDFRARTVIAIMEILLVMLVFRFWQGAGDSVLADMERTQRSRKPPTIWSSFLAYLFRLVRHALKPLSWLILLLVLDWLFPLVFTPAPMRLLWLLACWIVAGAALVQIIDAMARGGPGEDPRAALRRRSLQLVATVVVGVGLVLTVTANLVGRGAIYSWVLTFCWLLAIPVLFVITTWWRDRIDTLARLGAPKSRVLGWVSRNPDGIGGALGRIVAGFVLMVQGARVVIARRIRQLSLIREILGQRARKKASEQATADEESGRYVPLTGEELALLAPHGRPVSDVVPPDEKLHPAAPLPGHVLLVVGDRGHGKTTVVDRLLRASALPALYVEAGGDEHSIAEKIGQKLGCRPEAANIAEALKANPHCVAVDDLQRIMVPAIGGLRRLDAVLDLARHAAGPTSWVFAIGGAAWPFIARARGDRPLFDHKIHLHPWPKAKIRELIERRTEAAGIEPNFEYAGEDTGTMLFEEEIAPEERARRAFYSALTEETGGNPAVALERWRRSLFREKATGRVCVRTFKAPDIARLAAMPPVTLFVLRTILQMDLATPHQISLATDLSPTRVSEALRSCALLGVIERQGAGWRLTLYWFQEVKRLLLAQNLIAGELP